MRTPKKWTRLKIQKLKKRRKSENPPMSLNIKFLNSHIIIESFIKQLIIKNHLKLTSSFSLTLWSKYKSHNQRSSVPAIFHSFHQLSFSSLFLPHSSAPYKPHLSTSAPSFYAPNSSWAPLLSSHFSFSCSPGSIPPISSMPKIDARKELSFIFCCVIWRGWESGGRWGSSSRLRWNGVVIGNRGKGFYLWLT